MPRDVYGELASRLRDTIRHTARRERRQLQRWRVLSLNPLTAGHPDDDVIAASTDPDFHLASRVIDYDDDHGIDVGDILLVIEHDDEWTALDVEAG